MTNNKSKTDVAMRDMIFKLMSLARDVPLADAQIRSICDTVTPANVQHTTDLIRRLNTHEPKKKPTTAAIPASSVSTKHSLHKAPVLMKKPFPKCSEPGAVICADTFERLNAFEVQELKKLIKVCPFSLASQPCVRGKQCQLVRLCFIVGCDRGDRCFGSHDFTRTCKSVMESKPCNHKAMHKTKCTKNHHYKVRLFMSALRKPHELGFYGVGVKSSAPVTGHVKHLDVEHESVAHAERGLEENDGGGSEEDEDSIEDLAESGVDLLMGVMLGPDV